MKNNPGIGFIGFGEVGYYLAKGLKAAGIKRVYAFDSATGSLSEYKKLVEKRARDAGVELVSSMEKLIAAAELIILAVPGSLAPRVGRKAAQLIGAGKMFVDLTSCSPLAKEKAAGEMKSRGAKYVDVGLMAAPKEEGLRALMYSAGEGAREFKTTMSQYGMNIVVISDKAGDAATIKELWNIYTKGLQALLWEVVLASHQAGVDIGKYAPLIVKTSMGDLTYPLPQWLIMHAGLHAERKSGELREVAKAMRAWGIEPVVTGAAAKRLKMVAGFNLKEKFGAEMPGSYQEMLQAIDEISAKSKRQ